MSCKVAVGLMVATIAIALSPLMWGATWTVTTTASSGAGSFADALANSSAGDTIVIDASVSGGIFGTHVINKDLTIIGPGHPSISRPGSSAGWNSIPPAIMQNNATAVTVASGITCFISGLRLRASAANVVEVFGTLTIDHCFLPAGGGGSGTAAAAIYVASTGSLTLQDCRLESGGGPVWVDGTATLVDCEWENAGRPIYAIAGATVTASRCTFSNNGGSGTAYGGAAQILGTATFTNCTFTGNQANLGGGAIYAGYSGSSVTLTNCTVVGNSILGSSSDGGGICSAGLGGVIQLRNTLVALNSATGSGPDFFGLGISLGNNLIGDGSGSSNFVNGVNGDQVGSAASPVQPLIGVLADNGGLTNTRALLTGSPAINAGTSTGAPSTDQRGYGRSSSVDIGSFEFGGVPGGGGGSGSGGGGDGGSGGCSSSEGPSGLMLLGAALSLVVLLLRAKPIRIEVKNEGP